MNDGAGARATSGAIASYDRGREIASVLANGYVAAPPVHAGWRTYSCEHPVLAVAAKLGGQKYWVAGRWGVTQITTGQELHATAYHSEHGLPGNPVACLCIDKDEVAWAAAGEVGPGGRAALAWQEGDAWRIYPFPLPPPPGRLPSPVRVLAADPAGGVWAATGSAVYRILARDASPELVSQWPDRQAVDVMSLLADGNGVLAGTATGLFRIGGGGAVSQEEAGDLKECTALCRDQKRGTVWAAGSGVLLNVGGPAEKVTVPGGRRVRSLASYSRRVWVLTAAGLSFWQEDGGFREFPPGILPNPIYAISAYGGDHLVLLGTERGHGFAFLSLDTPDLPPRPIGPRVPPDRAHHPVPGHCNALAGPDGLGRIWVGGGGGLAVIPTAPEPPMPARPSPSGAPEPPEFAAVGDVVALFGPDAAGQVWVREVTDWLAVRAVETLDAESLAGGAGFTRLTEKRGPLPLQAAMGLDKRPVCLTGGGLWCFDGTAWRLDGPPLPGDGQPTALAWSPSGSWWAGTDGGLFTLAGGEWLAVNGRGLAPKGVRCLLSLDHTLWIGTTAGLWAWENDAFRLQPVDPARPDAPIQALAAATGGVWVALDRGVVKLDAATGKADPPVTPENSGLASSVVNAMLETGGELWLATAGGLSRWTIG